MAERLCAAGVGSTPRCSRIARLARDCRTHVSVAEPNCVAAVQPGERTLNPQEPLPAPAMDIESALEELLTPGKVSDDYKLGRELGT